MAHGLDDIRPIGPMNGDDEIRNIAPNESLYNLNVRNAINAANKGKTLTNVLGNLKITRYTLPYSKTGFPAGTNRCVGAYEDTKGGTIIFFVWNSQGNSQILRYYRNNTDPLNPYGEVQQVMMYNFGWAAATRITSVNVATGTPNPDASNGVSDMGDLLYWCDPAPRKINLTKGNICYKQKSWTLYAPSTWNSFSVGHLFNFNLLDINNNLIVNVGIQMPAQASNEAGLQYIANYINANYASKLTAVACQCSLTITEVGTNGFYYNMTGSGVALFLIPENWYGSALTDRFFDHCKWPAMFTPVGQYAADPNFLPNYVSQKVFQFRLQYDYDDLEEAVLGVWSQIAINNLQCNGSSNPLYNYLDVNFGDANLVNATTLVILKKITFIARETLSTNLGLNTSPDRAVIDLEICDFLDYNGTNWYCHFKFYNDVVSNPVDAATAALLFDDVPLTANAELLVKDRMVFGATLNGYDAPECPEVNLTVKINPVVAPPLYPVTFKIRILTYGLNFAEQRKSGGGNSFFDFFPTADKYPFWEPPGNARGAIFHNSLNPQNTNYAFWGGGSFQANGSFEIRAGMETTWGAGTQIAGWPVFARNTPYFGISKQISIGLPSDGNNALDTSTPAFVTAIGNFFTNGGPGGVPGDIYSTVTLMLPPGEQVIAVGDPSCSFGRAFLSRGFAYDLNGSTYQKTSSNVMGYFDSTGAWVKEKEIVINVTGAVTDGGTFVIMDTSPPPDANIGGGGSADFWQPLSLYLYDGTANPLGQGNDNMNSASYEGIPVEKAVVGYNSIGGNAGFPQNSAVNLGWKNCFVTDHNGYGFGINTAESGPLPVIINAFDVGSATNPIPNVTQIITGSFIIFAGTLTDVFNKTLTETSFQNGNVPAIATQLIAGAITTTNPNSRLACSTFIEGTVVDQNNKPVPQAGVIYTDGQTATTDINGHYELVAWGDMITPNLGNFNSSSTTLPNLASPNITSANDRTVDSLVFSPSPLCSVTYPFGQVIPNIIIQYFGGNPFSPSHPVVLLAFEIDENAYAEAKCLKRGGYYQVGLRCYDGPGRLCSVVGPFNLYIPFETEDLSLYPYVLQSNGTPYPPGSYLEGQPVVSWSFGPNTTAPQWTATYQLMRTQKTNYSKYLRWVLNGVQYISQQANTTTGAPAIDTAYANGNAVAVLLDISNTTVYNGQNPGANIGYVWTQGDRVRFIFNRAGGLLHSPSANLGQTGEMYDFPITGFYNPPTGNPYQLVVPIPELPFEIQSGFTVEIYTPKDLADPQQQIYYEVGNVYTCTNPGKTGNAFSVTSGVFSTGDTYWRGRLIQVDDAVTDYVAVYAALMEDASVSDLFPSLAEDIGRPGTVDPTFVQIFNPSYMRASDNFLPSTAYNGLSRIPNASVQVLEKTLDRRYGQIRRLFFEQNNLVAVMTTKEVSNYIYRETIYNAQNPTGIQALSTDFFGTEFVHENNFGTELPGSCVTNSGNIFGWTNARANYWRYLSNGEEAISDKKMISFFKQLSVDGVSDAVAAYDRYHEELIVTYWRNVVTALTVTGVHSAAGGYIITGTGTVNYVPAGGETVSIQYAVNGVWVTRLAVVTVASNGSISVQVDLPGVTPITVGQTINVIYSNQETLSWFEGTRDMKANRLSEHWITFYSYKPEWICSLNSEMFTFLNGEIWIQDKNPVYNNFYGVQYPTIVTPVFNEQPELVKTWNALWMMSFQSDGNCAWSSSNIYNNNGQRSRINAANWQQIEENWYTAFARDLNDTVATQPIVNGRYLRSSALVCQMTNVFTGELTLYGWRANFGVSERTTK